MPAFIIVHIPRVCMVRPVADAPAMERHQNHRMGNVSNQIIEPLVLRERPMAAVMTHHEQRPEHRALCKPKNRVKPPLIDRRCDRIKTRHYAEVPGAVGQGASSRRLKTDIRNRIANICQ